MLGVGIEILLYSGQYEVGGEDRKRNAYSTDDRERGGGKSNEGDFVSGENR